MKITGETKIAAVLGWPVVHTRSPQMINAAFAATKMDAVLVPLEVSPDNLGSAIAGLRAIRFIGASVTVPHKIEVAALCDELSPAAKTIGAVNCLEIKDDHITGHNTDAGGFLDGLVATGFDLRGKRTVILGAGGAARGCAYAVRGGRAVEVIARDPSSVSWASAWPWTQEYLRETFARADLVIDTTPVSLHDNAAERAFVDGLPLTELRPHVTVATLIYHRRSLLLKHAAERGLATLDGRAMLVHQGARAFTLWTGLPAPVDAMRAALDASVATA